MHYPGGVAGDFGRERSFSAGAGYEQGPLKVSLAYLNIHDPSLVGYGGTVLPDQTGYTSPVSSPVYSGYASASTLQGLGLGATYRVNKLPFCGAHVRRLCVVRS